MSDDDTPRLWWSATTHARCGWGLHWSMVDGKFVEPAALPADAVELRPVAPPRAEALSYLLRRMARRVGEFRAVTLSAPAVPDTAEPPDGILSAKDGSALAEAIYNALGNFPWAGGPDLSHVADQLVFAVLDAEWRPARSLSTDTEETRTDG